MPSQPTCNVDPPHEAVDDVEEIWHAVGGDPFSLMAGIGDTPEGPDACAENWVSIRPSPNGVVTTPGATVTGAAGAVGPMAGAGTGVAGTTSGGAGVTVGTDALAVSADEIAGMSNAAANINDVTAAPTPKRENL